MVLHYEQKKLDLIQSKMQGQLEPLAHQNYIDNYTKLAEYLNTITITTKNSLNRADIYKDVDREKFLSFSKI